MSVSQLDREVIAFLAKALSASESDFKQEYDEKGHLLHLDLGHQRLTWLPSEIGQLSHLQSLNLGSNRGKTLLEDKTLRAKGGRRQYCSDDPSYWQRFAQRIEEKYCAVTLEGKTDRSYIERSKNGAYSSSGRFP